MLWTVVLAVGLVLAAFQLINAQSAKPTADPIDRTVLPVRERQ